MTKGVQFRCSKCKEIMTDGMAVPKRTNMMLVSILPVALCRGCVWKKEVHPKYDFLKLKKVHDLARSIPK